VLGLLKLLAWVLGGGRTWHHRVIAPGSGAILCVRVSTKPCFTGTEFKRMMGRRQRRCCLRSQASWNVLSAVLPARVCPKPTLDYYWPPANGLRQVGRQLRQYESQSRGRMYRAPTAGSCRSGPGSRTTMTWSVTEGVVRQCAINGLDLVAGHVKDGRAS
jgi:hypothetical protein